MGNGKKELWSYVLPDTKTSQHLLWVETTFTLNNIFFSALFFLLLFFSFLSLPFFFSTFFSCFYLLFNSQLNFFSEEFFKNVFWRYLSFWIYSVLYSAGLFFHSCLHFLVLWGIVLDHQKYFFKILIWCLLSKLFFTYTSELKY